VKGVYIQCVRDLEPVQRSEDRCDKRRFRSFNYSTYELYIFVHSDLDFWSFERRITLPFNSV